MRIIAIDDEFFALENLRIALQEIGRADDLTCFSNCNEALDYLRSNSTNLAFVDINMGAENGLDLARKIKEVAPDCLIVFLTGYEEYSLDALRIHVFDYLLKPIDNNELKRVMNDVDKQFVYLEKKAFIKTFGVFDLFVNKQCVHFQSQKSKELLAFLVDRRGSVTTREAGMLFWPDEDFSRSRQSMLQTLIGKLNATLEEAGVPDIIKRERGSMIINPDAVDCDLFMLLENNNQGTVPFMGEYMEQYSWAESTKAWLAERYLGVTPPRVE